MYVKYLSRCLCLFLVVVFAVVVYFLRSFFWFLPFFVFGNSGANKDEVSSHQGHRVAGYSCKYEARFQFGNVLDLKTKRDTYPGLPHDKNG